MTKKVETKIKPVKTLTRAYGEAISQLQNARFAETRNFPNFPAQYVETATQFMIRELSNNQEYETLGKILSIIPGLISGWSYGINCTNGTSTINTILDSDKGHIFTKDEVKRLKQIGDAYNEKYKKQTQPRSPMEIMDEVCAEYRLKLAGATTFEDLVAILKEGKEALANKAKELLKK